MVFGVLYNSIRMLVGAISTLFLISRGLSLSEVGLLKTLQALLLLLLDLPTGYLADRWGRRNVVLLTVLCSAAWLIITGAATVKWEFYAAEAFNSISLALFNGAFVALMISNHRAQGGSLSMTELLSRYNFWLHIGMAIAAIVGSAFVAPVSSTIWFISGATLLVLMLAGFYSLPRNLPTLSNEKSRQTSFQQSISGIVSHGSSFFVSVAGLIAVSLFYQVIIQYWQPLSAVSLGSQHSALSFGVLFAAILLIQAAASWLSGRVSTNVMTLLIATAGFGCAAAVLLYALSGEYWMIPFIVVSLFGLTRFWIIGAQGKLHEFFPDHLRATFDSSVSTATRVLLMGIMPLTGFLMDQKGFSTLAYLGLAVTACLVIVLLLLAKATKSA